jgi:hypothetical protein
MEEEAGSQFPVLYLVCCIGYFFFEAGGGRRFNETTNNGRANRWGDCPSRMGCSDSTSGIQNVLAV